MCCGVITLSGNSESWSTKLTSLILGLISVDNNTEVTFCFYLPSTLPCQPQIKEKMSKIWHHWPSFCHSGVYTLTRRVGPTQRTSHTPSHHPSHKVNHFNQCKMMKTQTNPQGVNQLPRDSRTIADTHTHTQSWANFTLIKMFFLTLFTMWLCVCMCVWFWMRLAKTLHERMQKITPWKRTRTQKCIKLCEPKLFFFSPSDEVFQKKKKNKAIIFHFHMKTLSFCHDQLMKAHVYSTYCHCPNCKYEHGHQVKSLAERKHRYINTRGGVDCWFSTLLIELWLW